MNPNLGAYRQYHEAFVLNGLYALAQATGSKGTIVSITGFPLATGYNPVNNDFWGSTTLNLGQPNTYSARYELNSRVTATPSGGVPLGLQLYDVLETNPYGESLIWREQERAERQIVLSGQAVPIVTKGIFYILNGQGPISGQCPAVARTGIPVAVPVVPASETQIGIWLGTTGVDGGALLKLDL